MQVDMGKIKVNRIEVNLKEFGKKFEPIGPSDVS